MILARADRMKQYGDLLGIDTLVKRSQGAYTHDEVWYLTNKFVRHLLLMHYEQDCLQQRIRNYKEKINATHT